MPPKKVGWAIAHHNELRIDKASLSTRNTPNARKERMAIEFRLPELGENIEAADVLNVLVKPGDVIQKDQAVLELEAEKAVLELPCPHAGRIEAMNVKAGDRILFSKWSGTEVRIDGEDLLIMKESDILGVLEGQPSNVRKAA